MKVIITNRNEVILVDDEDYEMVKDHAWRQAGRGSGFRAKIRGRTISIGRYILNYDGPLVVDHINRDQADNRKENLRICSQYQNTQNNGRPHPGVNFHTLRRKWRAYIKVNNKTMHLGLFDTLEEAVEARKTKEKQLGKI